MPFVKSKHRFLSKTIDNTLDNSSMAKCWKKCTYIVSNSICFVLYDDVFDPHLEMFLDLI